MFKSHIKPIPLTSLSLSAISMPPSESFKTSSFSSARSAVRFLSALSTASIDFVSSATTSCSQYNTSMLAGICKARLAMCFNKVVLPWLVVEERDSEKNFCQFIDLISSLVCDLRRLQHRGALKHD